MNQFVCLQVAFSDESLATVLIVADEGAFSRVDSQVSLEIACLMELSQTLAVWTIQGFLGSSRPHILVVALIQSQAGRLNQC